MIHKNITIKYYSFVYLFKLELNGSSIGFLTLVNEVLIFS